jgi:hypothetical protein
MAKTKTIYNCTMEIDQDRGVIYVHHSSGRTILRICRIPKPVRDPMVSGMIDICYGVDTTKAPAPYIGEPHVPTVLSAQEQQDIADWNRQEEDRQNAEYQQRRRGEQGTFS